MVLGVYIVFSVKLLINLDNYLNYPKENIILRAKYLYIFLDLEIFYFLIKDRAIFCNVKPTLNTLFKNKFFL